MLFEMAYKKYKLLKHSFIKLLTKFN